VCLFFFILGMMGVVAQEPGIVVDTIEICTSVIDRQPVDSDSVFASTVERLYCFTRITSENAPITISHVWYYNDREMAKIELGIKDKNWRTWSSKKIVAEWSGKWRVEVVSADGSVIQSKTFTVQ
jgi:hypothetical protein